MKYAEENNVKLLYSPPYSSCKSCILLTLYNIGMSPVEKCWNIVKGALRRELADLDVLKVKTFRAMVEEQLENL